MAYSRFIMHYVVLYVIFMNQGIAAVVTLLVDVLHFKLPIRVSASCWVYLLETV